MTVPKPTKAYIEALVSWAGGSLTELSYSQTPSSGREPAAIEGTSSGFWGGFYVRVAREMNFHRLAFHSEIRGDATLSYLPPDLPIQLPATGPSKARALHNQLFVGDPQVTVDVPDQKDGSQTRQESARRMTQYLQACIQGDERRSDNAPIVWAKANCIQHGLGAVMAVLDIADWPKEPVRAKGESAEDYQERQTQYRAYCATHDPIKTRSLSPLTVCYDRSQSPPRWAFTRQAIMPWDAVQQYPSWAASYGAEEAQTTGALPSAGAAALVKVEFWTPEWTACYIAGHPAYGPGDSKGRYKANSDGIAKNPYGFIPIDFAPGGGGAQDPDGLPEWELRGMYADAMDLLLLEASCMVQEEIQRQKASWGQKVVIDAPGQPGLANALERQVVSSPTKVVKVTEPGVRIYQLDPTPLSPILTDQRNRIREQIDQATVHDIAFGAGSPTEPARRTALRLHQIDKQAAQGGLNLEQMLESHLTKRLLTVRDVYKKPVGRNMALPGQPALYAELDPSDIPPVFTVTVNLLGETDEEKQNLQAQAGDRLERGTLDRYTAMQDYYKDKDPDAILAGLLADKAMDGPILEQFLAGMMAEWPKILAEVAAEEGIIMSNEELQKALPPPPQPATPPGGMMGSAGVAMPLGTQNGQMQPPPSVQGVTPGGHPYAFTGA